MITPAYNLTATERVLPRLALDFTTGILDARVTVARALDTATRVNNSGFIEGVNANLPRFDYEPITFLPKGLLIEETRQNVLLASQSISAPNWSFVGGSSTLNAGTSPSGTTDADLLVADLTLGQHRVDQNTTIPAIAHTFSVFAKNGGYNFVRLRIGAIGAVFDLTTGTASGASAGVTTQAVQYPSGWWRVNISCTAVANDPVRINAQPTTSTANFSGDGVSGIYIWGAQLEAGAFPTSYIPTTTTSLTRNADAVSMTGTNFSSWWVATMGGATAQYVPSTVSGTRPVIQFDDNTADNIIALRGNTTNPELYIKATTDQAQIDAGTIAANTNYGLSGAWNTDDCAAAINGGSAVTDTIVTIPTVTQARLGSDGTNYLNGRLQTVRYWPQRITNAETQAFSKL